MVFLSEANFILAFLHREFVAKEGEYSHAVSERGNIGFLAFFILLAAEKVFCMHAFSVGENIAFLAVSFLIAVEEERYIALEIGPGIIILFFFCL